MFIVALSMVRRLVWFRGPFFGSEADLSICRKSFDPTLTQLNRFAIGDSSYRGLDNVIRAPKTFGPGVSANLAVLATGRVYHSARAFVECYIHRLRCWEIMDAYPFRHDYMDHAIIAMISSRLTALSVDLAPLQKPEGYVYNHKS